MLNNPFLYFVCVKSVHPEQLPQRPWITLRERDQMMPTGTESLLMMTNSVTAISLTITESVI